jgi:hypothetical protein
MSEPATAEIISIAPKKLSGKKGNAQWSITYYPSDRKWLWNVSIAVEPHLFNGTGTTEAEAMKLVNDILNSYASGAKR